MDRTTRCNSLRNAVKQSFGASSEGVDLLACIDAWEEERSWVSQLERLQEENTRLTEQLKKLRALYAKDSGHMSSRLRDALRE